MPPHQIHLFAIKYILIKNSHKFKTYYHDSSVNPFEVKILLLLMCFSTVFKTKNWAWVGEIITKFLTHQKLLRESWFTS